MHRPGKIAMDLMVARCGELIGPLVKLDGQLADALEAQSQAEIKRAFEQLKTHHWATQTADLTCGCDIASAHLIAAIGSHLKKLDDRFEPWPLEHDEENPTTDGALNQLDQYKMFVDHCAQQAGCGGFVSRIHSHYFEAP